MRLTAATFGTEGDSRPLTRCETSMAWSMRSRASRNGSEATQVRGDARLAGPAALQVQRDARSGAARFAARGSLMISADACLPRCDACQGSAQRSIHSIRLNSSVPVGIDRALRRTHGCGLSRGLRP